MACPRAATIKTCTFVLVVLFACRSKFDSDELSIVAMRVIGEDGGVLRLVETRRSINVVNAHCTPKVN